MIHHISITSRTGYETDTRAHRAQEAVAILLAMTAIAAIVMAVGWISNLLA